MSPDPRSMRYRQVLPAVRLRRRRTHPRSSHFIYDIIEGGRVTVLLNYAVSGSIGNKVVCTALSVAQALRQTLF